MVVNRALTGLRPEYPDLTSEKVDVTVQPGRAWKDGIRMIPTLRDGDRILSGLFLSPGNIRRFIEERQKD